METLLTNNMQTIIESSFMVDSHLQFSQLLREPELIVEEWVTLYYMGAFKPVIWSTIVRIEKFNNGLCTHFLQLHGLKSSLNSSCLKNCRCELSLKEAMRNMTVTVTTLVRADPVILKNYSEISNLNE